MGWPKAWLDKVFIVAFGAETKSVEQCLTEIFLGCFFGMVSRLKPKYLK
jgi:hypothetical protein